MNAIQVIVSIHILMLLAKFNHAHGLSTFGMKTVQQQVEGIHCLNQSACAVIKGTTCLRGFCYCGDNSHPANGVCRDTLRSVKHICKDDDECVVGADCVEQKSNSPKTCQCQEGLIETQSGTCGGMSNFIVFPGLLVLTTILLKMY